MQKFSLPSPKCVQDACGGDRTDYWIMADAAELPTLFGALGDVRLRDIDTRSKWFGGNSAQIAERCKKGDASIVPASDALLSEMSAYTMTTARRGYLMDVAGAVPSVPAYLSGNPLNMRRRVKTQDEYAPLAIIYDPTCSANIKPSQIFDRGIVVLALVRALAGLRPIELWVAGGLDADSGKNGGYFAARVETAPLDLARAAWMLTSADFPRGVAYGVIKQQFNARGAWPYGNHQASLGINFRDIVLQAFPHVSDVLAIPAIHSSDELLTNPKSWLKRTFNELAGQQQEAA